MFNNQKGLSTPLLIGIMAIALLVGAAMLFSGEEEEEFLPASGESYPYTNQAQQQAAPKASGGSIGVRDFDKSAYDRAVADGKLVIVFTNSPTCGEQCVKEINIMRAVFADSNYSSRPIAGFIADINKDKAFANSIKLFAPDGKAVIWQGKVEAFSPLSWNRFDYENYIEIYTYGEEDE